MGSTLRALARRRRFASPLEEAEHLRVGLRAGTVAADLLDLAALAGHAPAAIALGREPALPDPEAFDGGLAAQPRVVWVRAVAALARAVHAASPPSGPPPSDDPGERYYRRDCYEREAAAFEPVLAALEARTIDRAVVFERARPLSDDPYETSWTLAGEAARLTLEDVELSWDDTFELAEHELGDEAQVRSVLGPALVDLALEGDLPVVVDGVAVEGRAGRCFACEAELEERSGPCPECGHAYGQRAHAEPTEEERREDEAWQRRVDEGRAWRERLQVNAPPGPSARTALLAIFGLPIALMAFVGLLIAVGVIR